MSSKKSAKTKESSKANKVNNEVTSSFVDLLDEDKPIAGQKYVCLSFISPEEIIKNKQLFFFDNFLKTFELKKSLDKFSQFLNFLSYKYNVNFDKISKDLEDFVEEEREKLFLTTLDDEYKSFLDQNEDKLQKEYNEINNFQTNVRGVKVRGVFSAQEEAENRCKLLRQDDPNHDVYVGQVGMWMPFHPEAYKTGKVEYLEKELNQLMAEKKKNDDTSKEEFYKRVKDAKRKAIEENVEKAKQEGNKLLQTIDEDGNLVNADRMDVPGKNLLFGDGENDDVVTADLRKELFNSEDVIVGKQENNDHGLSQVLENKKKQEQLKNIKEETESSNNVDNTTDISDLSNNSQ
jgi:hypothetical protein